MGTIDAFIFPVRFVRIISTQNVAGTLIIRFTVQGFPDVDSWPRTLTALQDYGKARLHDISARYGRYYPAVAQSDGLQIIETNSETARWAEVTNRVSMFDAFANSYFMMITLEYKSDRPAAQVAVSEDGIVVLSRSLVVVRCWFYGNKFHDDGRIIRIQSDENILRAASDSSYEIHSRYDDVEFWLHARQVTEKSRTILTVTLPGDPSRPGDLQTRISIPVVVKKPVLRRVGRGFLSATGASLVALPALLGTDAALTPRIIAAGVGATIIAIVTVFSS
ncbi:hypothetical protein MPY17_13900 [Rhodococcus opacus]|uniref:hypothetical protein n=1 Tax=Rhodococcus opacus TaxID=37919 RepID=UPI001FF34148|nr:hypothetical protein [Rhodococcus opacus]UOT06762.1 hypothetical protein MPY17_13900 [Rhodococcus opacus]